MNDAKASRLKQQIVQRARAMGMDPNNAATCSPGIKALAQMYRVAIGRPELLVAFADDLVVHDFRVLATPDAPDQFVWTVRAAGTNLFFPGSGRDLRSNIARHPDSLVFTFDGQKLERVLNLDYAVRFIDAARLDLAA